MKVERDSNQGLYIISVAASLADVHPQTLRLYERKGLLRPARTAKNRRRYSEDDIQRLRRIQELTGQGLNLSGVSKVLAMEEEMQALQAKFARMQADMEETARAMREQMMELKRHVALRVRPPTSIVRRR
ncbi:MAG TPA: MerR family transcriptional regulator [Candidatus Anoxymicrobiaceae bacterium]|jgi:MerR family transcriptional regulator, heat shock protein HspR